MPTCALGPHLLQGFYEGAIQTAEAVADTLSGLLKKA